MRKRADQLEPGDVVQTKSLTGTVTSAVPNSVEIKTRYGTFYRRPHELVEVIEPTITVTLKRSEALAWSSVWSSPLDASPTLSPILDAVREALKRDC